MREVLYSKKTLLLDGYGSWLCVSVFFEILLFFCCVRFVRDA